MGLQVLESSVGVSIVSGSAIIVVDWIALEPLLESHRTHNVVVGHRVEGVESILNSFLGWETNLESGRHSSARVSIVVEDFTILECPWLNDVGVGVVGFGYIVLFVLFVEEEHLCWFTCTRLNNLYQSLSWVFSHTASVLNRNYLLYSEKSFPVLSIEYPKCWSRSLRAPWLWHHWRILAASAFRLTE